MFSFTCQNLDCFGGVLLALTAAVLREIPLFFVLGQSRGAWLSLLNLAGADPIIAFVACMWLIHHESPAEVGIYAYLHPVVAVLLGYFLGRETLGLRTILGTLLVLSSVAVGALSRSLDQDSRTAAHAAVSQSVRPPSRAAKKQNLWPADGSGREL